MLFEKILFDYILKRLECTRYEKTDMKEINQVKNRPFCILLNFSSFASYSHASLHIHSIITLPDTLIKLNEKCVKKQRGVQA